MSAPRASLPLSGIRVIDMTHLLAGPFATMIMADNGADVIKVEPPTGDISRARAPLRPAPEPHGAMSGYFLAMNRGKRSVVLDLRSDHGREAFGRLLGTADVLVENFRPGVLVRLGWDPVEVASAHPRMIVASMSAFGHTGVPPELRDRPGVAIVAEAASGITGVTRARDGKPTWVGWALGDLTAGLVLYAAVATALVARERTGLGARLDLSMTEAMLALYGPSLGMHALGGKHATDGIPPAIPFGVYPARDGYVALGVNTDEFWRRLCLAAGHPEHAADPRYATYLARIERREETDALVSSWTAEHERHALVALLERHGVPCALVGGPGDVLADPALNARGAFWRVDDGLDGDVVLPADPLRFAAGPAGPVPRLGQHTDEVLAELGLDAKVP